MPISVRLKPAIESLLAQTSRRTRRTRSALIHDALTVFLKPQRPRLGTAISAALAEAPEGCGLDRAQPKTADKRNWGR